MKYYNEQLKKLNDQVVRKSHLETLLKDLKTQQAAISKEIELLKTAASKEQSDVDHLEGKTLSALFYSIIGQKSEKLDKERAEALAANLKLEAASKNLESINSDINKYQAELDAISDCEENYNNILNEKREAVKSTGDIAAAEILELEEHIANLETQIKETDEAIDAGNEAMEIINSIKDDLEGAESWGMFDLFAGGLISTAIKHSALDSAQEQIENLQIALRRFKTELSDVSLYTDIQINVDGFLRFADYFFDGIIADFMVLDKINTSQEEVENIEKHLTEAINALKTMKQAANDNIDKSYSKLNSIVLNA